MKRLNFYSFFLLLLIVGSSCQKERNQYVSLKNQIQGTWKLQSAICEENGSWYDAISEFEGTTAVFNEDSLTWHSPSETIKARGLFTIKSKTIQTNCTEDEDGVETCDCETINSISSELSLLTPITQNYVTPIYIDANTGETINVCTPEFNFAGNKMTWRIWRNSKWYDYNFVKN